jgi:hypothetical protein
LIVLRETKRRLFGRRFGLSCASSKKGTGYCRFLKKLPLVTRLEKDVK